METKKSTKSEVIHFTVFAKMQEHRGKLGDEEVSNPISPYPHRCLLVLWNKNIYMFRGFKVYIPDKLT